MEPGFAQGIEQGAIERETKAILRTLTKRFQSVPRSLEAYVHAVTDLERLEHLADFALEWKTMGEFAEALE